MGLLDKLLGRGKETEAKVQQEAAAAKAAAEEAARKRREELAAEAKRIEDSRKRAEEELAKRKAEIAAKAEAEAAELKKRGEAMAAAMRAQVETPKVEGVFQTYVVKSGDSLSKIAKELLGDAKRWPELYEMNKELIGANPNLIHPGQELKLPK